MTIRDMADILHARVLIGEDKLDLPVFTACCSDLMSDVLAFVNEKTVLITGLTNPHVIRTSEMPDLKCVIFSRGKVPTADIVEQAQELGMVILSTKETAFVTCGLLYSAGLRGVPIEWKTEEAQ